MSPLATFGMCILLVIALITVLYLVAGQGASLLIIIFPAIAAQAISREKGVDFGGKSFVYASFLFLFIATEILLAATIFFGLYCLFWGYPATNTTLEVTQHTFDKATLVGLQYINKILLLMESYFVLMYIYNSFKYNENYKKMSTGNVFMFRILPALSFPLGFIYLLASLNFLSVYPTLEAINTIARMAGYIYVVYLIYSLGRSLLSFTRLFQFGFPGAKFSFYSMLFIGLAYNVLFLYFFYKTHAIMYKI